MKVFPFGRQLIQSHAEIHIAFVDTGDNFTTEGAINQHIFVGTSLLQTKPLLLSICDRMMIGSNHCCCCFCLEKINLLFEFTICFGISVES